MSEKIKPMIFGVDLDGVVGNYNQAFRKSVAISKGLNPDTMGEPPDWDFVTAPGWFIKSKDEYLALHTTAVTQHHIFKNMPVNEGAVDALWRISDAGVTVRIVTHRLVTNGSHGTVVADTVGWLEENHVPFRDLCFIADKAAAVADLYIDDAPHNIIALREAYGEDKAIIFDQSYNRHMDGLRVDNWSDLADMVLERQVAGGFFVDTSGKRHKPTSSWRA